MKPAEFWELTPAELAAWFNGFVENQKEQYKMSIMNAYYTAALERQKRLPKFETLIKNIDKKAHNKKQSTEEMLNAIKAINANIRRNNQNGNL